MLLIGLIGSLEIYESRGYNITTPMAQRARARRDITGPESEPRVGA